MSLLPAQRRVQVAAERLEGRRLLHGALITGHKFYDANANGLDDDGQSVPGVEIRLDVGNDGSWDYSAFTDANGNYVFGDLDNWDGDNDPRTGSDIWAGEYKVAEVVPPGGNWVQTYGQDGYIITVLEAEPDNYPEYGGNNFGNVEIACPDARTKGFWQNKNGFALMNDGDTVQPELDLLNALNLKNGSGSDVTFNSYAEFKAWLKNASAKEMRYMLSAQLAAMALNVESGLVSSDALVIVDGGTKTIGDVMDEANAALNDSGASKGELGEIKDILDAANNNLNFVCGTPTTVLT